MRWQMGFGDRHAALAHLGCNGLRRVYVGAVAESRRYVGMAFSLVSAGVALVICAAQSVHAQKFDPNAPEKKTVTVGSEIKRGSSAVFEAQLELPSNIDVVAAWRAAANTVITQNQQRNTDTDGFLLGAHFRAWTKMAVLVNLDSPVVDTARAHELGRIDFAEYRKLQRQLGIDDATLSNLAGIRHDAIKNDIDRWSKLK